MASQKPISTISYNTEGFLREKLDAWLKAHIIQSYQYICHIGEDGDKDHIHLRIEPNKRLDPMDLQEQLREFTKDNEKPLGCRPFRPSKEEDWILYALHDPDYLNIKYGGAEKGEKIEYEWTDIRAPFDYDTEIAVIRAKQSLKHTAPALVKEIQQGTKVPDLIARGENIFTMNAVIRALSQTDYLRVLDEIKKKNIEIELLYRALDKIGYVVDVGDKGEIALQKISKQNILAEIDIKFYKDCDENFFDIFCAYGEQYNCSPDVAAKALIRLALDTYMKKECGEK